MIDTGCAYASSGGASQYKAYCRHTGLQEDISTNDTVKCKFGVGAVTSTRTTFIQFSINDIWLRVKIHIVDADVPLLLSLADINHLRLRFDNLCNTITHVPTNTTAPITRHHSHPFVTWNPLTYCLFTEPELRRLHKRFGHPSAEKLHNLLKRSDYSDIDENTRQTLQRITRQCQPSQVYAQALRRFQFSLRDEKHFTSSVYVDIFYILSRPVLHVVDEATRYQAARWLENVSAETVWRAMRLRWVDVYLGPPDTIVYDAGKQFLAKAFQSNAALLHIKTKSVPIESPNLISYIERYHAPICKAFMIINDTAPDLHDEEVLQMSIKSINDSVGPDGLIPTLLVYGAIPRLGFPQDRPVADMHQRDAALRKATEEATKQFSRRQVRDAVRTRNGPDTSEINTAPLGSHVLVYRPEKDKLDGPFSLLAIDDEYCTVLLPPPSGPSKFRSTVAKRFTTDPDHSPHQPHQLQPNPKLNRHTNQFSSLPLPHTNPTAYHTNTTQTISTAKPTYTQTPINDNRFLSSRLTELEGLYERGVFQIAHKSDANGMRILGSRFVDTIKNDGTLQAFKKSRYVIQGFNDKQNILTYAPTVQRASQRLLLSIAPSEPSFQIILRDVTQAYAQSEDNFQRNIFTIPSSFLNLPTDTLFKVIRPLYGIPEAGIYSYKTYLKYHRDELGMTPSTYDPCFLYTTRCIATPTANPDTPRGIVCLQTDDTIYACNDTFKDLEKSVKSRFDSKHGQSLTSDSHIKFNGTWLRKNNTTHTLSLPEPIQKLLELDPETFTKEQLTAERARGAYITAICRPNVTYSFSRLLQFIEPTSQECKDLNKTIRQCKLDGNLGLNFVALEASSVSIGLFIDAGFATNRDLTSQLGFVMVSMDEQHRANIIPYGSAKSKRVTRSVLTAEMFAMIQGFDVCSAIRLTINDMFNKIIPLRIYTDSRSLFDCLTNKRRTTKKSLLIDLAILRESYERRKINDVFWIPTEQTRQMPLPRRHHVRHLTT